MSDSKHVLQSKTVQASIINIIAAIFIFVTAHNVQDKYFAVVNIVTALFAIYGRITAKHKLYVRKKDGDNRKTN